MCNSSQFKCKTCIKEKKVRDRVKRTMYISNPEKIHEKQMENKEASLKASHDWLIWWLSMMDLQQWWMREGGLGSSAYQKALDTILHNTLLSKLQRCGFDGWSTQWIRYWVDGHIQTVVVNGLMSKWSQWLLQRLQGVHFKKPHRKLNTWYI